MIVLRYLYVAWAMLLFIFLLLVFYPILMASRLMPPKRAHAYCNPILRAWSLIWLTLIFIRVKAVDRDKAKGNTPVVFATNHSSYLDTPVSYITVPELFKTLAKKELTKMPLMGHVFLTSGIMVDRNSPEGRKASFQRMVDVIKGGTSILIFPEGTQNRTPEPLRDFYAGAFRLAIETQVPLQPIVTVNSRWLMPSTKVLKLTPGTIRQVYLDPIPTAGMTSEDLDGLRDSVRSQLEAKLRELDPHYAK